MEVCHAFAYMHLHVQLVLISATAVPYQWSRNGFGIGGASLLLTRGGGGGGSDILDALNFVRAISIEKKLIHNNCKVILTISLNHCTSF